MSGGALPVSRCVRARGSGSPVTRIHFYIVFVDVQWRTSTVLPKLSAQRSSAITCSGVGLASLTSLWEFCYLQSLSCFSPP